MLKVANRFQCPARRPARQSRTAALVILAGGAVAVLLVGMATGQWPGAMAPADPVLSPWLVNALALGPALTSRFAIGRAARGRWATIRVASSGELSVSWRKDTEVVERTAVRLARWRSGDQPVDEGLVALIPFEAGTVVLGGADHDGLGYWTDGFPTVSRVDAWLPAADFERLLAALPTARTREPSLVRAA